MMKMSALTDLCGNRTRPRTHFASAIPPPARLRGAPNLPTPPVWCGGKGLFRADPPSTIAQKRPKGPQGRNACFHHRGSSRKSSPRGV